jgi:predicted PurR-regulated permease PerM
MHKVQAILWQKRGLAVLVMTILLLLVLIVPLSFAVVTVVNSAGDIVAWFKSLETASIPKPPEWVGKLPLLGTWVVTRWQRLAAASAHELSQLAAPYVGKGVGWFAAQAGSFGMVILHFLLTVIISAILYANGEKAAAGMRAFARRLAGQQGEEAAILSAKAVRGVAMGVVLTAFIQSLLGGVGLFVAGVPAVVLLTAVMLLLCICQVGPSLVLIPAVIWLFWNGQTLWGIILLIWAVFVSTIDNFIRPVLIKKGADIPILLIFAGVIGGLIAFGIIGLFIGPVMLAVTYTLVRAWVNGEGGPEAAALSTPAAGGSESPLCSDGREGAR